MTPRQRIINALQHRESDRVPIDLGATNTSGITGIVYNRLKKYLGVSGKTMIYDIGQMIAKVEPSIIKIVGSDAIPLLIEPKQWKTWKLQDGSIAEIPANAIFKKCDNGDIVQVDNDGIVVRRCSKGGLYFDKVLHPLKNVKTLNGIDAGKNFFGSFDWPSYIDEDFNDLNLKAKKLFDETLYAIVGNLWVHLLAASQDLRGFENFMMDLIVNKSLAHHLLSRLVEYYIPRIDKYIEAVGQYVQIIMVSDDLGTQNGLQISPELYREMIKPYHKKLWQYIKEKSKKPILMHSDGSIYELIPDLIEMGIDALNPIQVSATNMDTKKLKKEFGRDITFWGGGCDTQTILSRGTPNYVRQEVRKRVADLAPGGGFVFCQVHNIQPDIPVENILAMYEELGTFS